MEEKQTNLSFFSRIKIAVIKLEDYSVFLEEKTSVAVKYFFKIILIFSLVIAIVQTYKIMNVVSKGYKYIKEELPNFSYENGDLSFSNNVEAYDHDLDFYFLVNTNELTSEELEQYKSKIKSTGIIMLKDKAIYCSKGIENEYNYSMLAEQYNLEKLNKEELIEKIDEIGIIGITVTIFVVILISMYLANLIATYIDWLMISIFAYVTSKICKINMLFKQSYNISIYALTLSIILSMIYQVVYILTDFYMPYFRTMYLLISYVYVVAVILMIKSDLIKQQIEVSKIVEIQEEVHQELENKKKEKTKEEPEEKDKEKDKKEDDENIPGQPEAE